MDDALKYLEAVLPPTGLRVVAYHPPKWKSGFKHIFCETNEEVIRQAQALEDAGIQSWIATATYADKKAGRKASNVAELRSLFLDLDYKQYESEGTGNADLQRLADVIGKPTLVVSSGGGIHAYWQLSRAMPVDEWRSLALAFQTTWQGLGVKADPVSADAARVLRMPGTFNRKEGYNPPRPVLIKSWGGGSYDPDGIAKAFTAPRPTVRPTVIPLHVENIPPELQTSNDDLMGGDPAFFKPMVMKCRQMQWIFNHRKALPEPLWYAALGLVGYLEDGRAAAHVLSKGDPRYNQEDTDRKLNQALANTSGPSTCARFKELNPKGCEGCPYNITSPIMLGREEVESVEPQLTVEAMALAPTGEVVTVEQQYKPPVPMPAGFKYDGQYTYRVVRDEETGLPRDEMIFAGFLCLERIAVSQVGGGKIQGVRHINSDGTRQIYIHALGQEPVRTTIPSSALRDKRDFSKRLGGAVPMDPKNIAHLLTLMNQYEAALSATSPWAVAAPQMGWQEDGSFIVGTTKFGSDGAVTPDVPVNDEMRSVAQSYAPKGELETWKRAAAIYDHDGAEPYQFALCYGAAGVFLPRTREAGVLLSLYSQASAKGKSTVGRAAVSWWADPWATGFKTTDTVNRIFRTASFNKNLPLLIDELTSRKPEQVEEIVYDLCQGREKARMSSTLAIRAPLPPWALPAISTSNTSIRNKLVANRGDAQGTLARVIEIPMDLAYAKGLDNSYEQRRLIASGFDDNYGWAGPTLVLYVMRNREACDRALDGFCDLLDKALGRDPTYRFWIASCAATLTVCAIANNIGLITYDLGRLIRWTVRMLRTQKTESAAAVATPSDILAQFLEVNTNRMVRVYNRNGPTGAVRVVDGDAVRGSVVVGRLDLPEGVMYLSCKAFSEFCASHGYDSSAFERNALIPEPTTGATLLTADEPFRRVSVGSGTPYVTSGKLKCLRFNLAHPDLRDYAVGAGAVLPPETRLRVV